MNYLNDLYETHEMMIHISEAIPLLKKTIKGEKTREITEAKLIAWEKSMRDRELVTAYAQRRKENV